MTHCTEPRRRDVLLAALAMLSGCGGVDSGGTGTGASSTYASGPITGFGSIIVNGVRFDDSNASVQDDDGVARSRDDLRLGMRTEILASSVITAAGVSSASATSIRLQRALLGPLDSVDAANGRLVVLGQNVNVTAGTAFDAAITAGIASLLPGDLLEIYAALDVAGNRFVASRIERRVTAATYALRGAVSSLTLASQTLTIGQLTIDWSGVVPTNPVTTLAPGRILRLKLATSPVGGTWRATALVSGRPMPEDGEIAQVEGRITAFTSPAAFDLDGLPVDASKATFPEGTTALALGARIEIHGSVRGGVLVATKVEIEGAEDGPDAFELHGSITSVDVAGSRFVVRSVTVTWNGGTSFDSSTAADIRVGRVVEVHGRLAGDGLTVLATTVHVES